MRKLIISSAAALALAAPLAGCNTVSGFGEDLQVVGDALTRASDDVQRGDNTRTARADVELCGGSGASRRGNC